MTGRANSDPGREHTLNLEFPDSLASQIIQNSIFLLVLTALIFGVSRQI